MLVYERKDLVKASTLIYDDKPYTIWLIVIRRIGGRVKLQYLYDEISSSYPTPDILLHMVNNLFLELKIDFPEGLPSAKICFTKDAYGQKHPFFRVKESVYRLDKKIDGNWINNSGVLPMVKYIREKREKLGQRNGANSWVFKIQELQ